MTTTPPTSLPPPVYLSEWRDSPEFLHFLGLIYQPSPEVSAKCLTLLPVAIAEDRIVGAIRTAILSEALSLFNTPPQKHYFRYSPRLEKWTYKGTSSRGLVTHIYYGRLNRVLPAGRFCLQPYQVLLPGFTWVGGSE